MLANRCTNKAPAPGTVRTLKTAHLGAKFVRMHGRTIGDCAECGHTGLALTSRGNLPPHNKPAD